MSLDKGIVGTLDKAQPLRFHHYNGKIADITESDTNKHTVDISAYVPTNCVAVCLNTERESGTGELGVYPNEGSRRVFIEAWGSNSSVIAIINQRIQYGLIVANDDYDLYMLGYFTEG